MAAASTKPYEHSSKPSYVFLMFSYLIFPSHMMSFVLDAASWGHKREGSGEYCFVTSIDFFNIKPQHDINHVIRFCEDLQLLLGTNSFVNRCHPAQNLSELSPARHKQLCDQVPSGTKPIRAGSNSAQTVCAIGVIRHKIPNFEVSPGTKAMGDSAIRHKPSDQFAFGDKKRSPLF